MAFQTKTWRARQGVGLNKFSVGGAPPVTLVNVPDQVLVQGDAFSEENMNDLERRIAFALSSVYGVKIDKTNSNPDTAVTYTDNAVGLAPSSGNNGAFAAGDWEDKYPYNSIRPCLLKNGVVVGYLNKSDFTKFEDGSAADITSGNAGDVMIEIPRFYYRIRQDATYTYVQISDAKRDGFTDWGFSYNGVIKDKFYVGAYLGYVDGSNKLRSISGAMPTGSKTIGAFRTAARANGTGYEQLSFNKFTALQALYLIRFKSLNSQIALGQGFTSGSAYENTGSTNDKGMYYGTTAATVHCKLLGIEDFYGNLYQWVDGYRSAANIIQISDGNFNDTGSGYIQVPYTYSTLSGYMSDVAGDNQLAFTPRTVSGSSSTYYSDNSYLGSGYLPFCGGYRSGGAFVGAFYFDCINSASVVSAAVGARLLFCG